jgi:RNA polymerase sigma factor (sigma-70 family)
MRSQRFESEPEPGHELRRGRQHSREPHPFHTLYAELQPQLRRILSSNLQPPEWVIDDACQSAWRSLLERHEVVRPGGELGWLSTTATRTALRLMRRERLLEPNEQLREPPLLQERRATLPDPSRAAELRERLAEVRRLPVREQRVLWMHGFGYEYQEIAAATGDTRRTVARQLTRARQRLLRLAESE